MTSDDHAQQILTTNQEKQKQTKKQGRFSQLNARFYDRRIGVSAAIHLRDTASIAKLLARSNAAALAISLL